jgi:hypothetical protein
MSESSRVQAPGPQQTEVRGGAVQDAAMAVAIGVATNGVTEISKAVVKKLAAPGDGKHKTD